MIENGEVRKHSRIVVIENWIFTFIFLGLIITTFPMSRDVIFHVSGIIGEELFPTPDSYLGYHQIFGILLVIAAVFQIIIHSLSPEQDILMKKPVRDYKGFVHSLFFLIGFAKRQEPGGGERFLGRQRMVYLALAYGIGLLAMSGAFMYISSSDGTLHGIFLLTHLMAAALIYLVLTYHFAINLRTHDKWELRCSFNTGTLPLWHIKKHHKIWYREIRDHEKNLAVKQHTYQPSRSSDPVASTIIKLAEMENLFLPTDLAEKLAEKFRDETPKQEVEDFVKTSRLLQ